MIKNYNKGLEVHFAIIVRVLGISTWASHRHIQFTNVARKVA